MVTFESQCLILICFKKKFTTSLKKYRIFFKSKGYMESLKSSLRSVVLDSIAHAGASLEEAAGVADQKAEGAAERLDLHHLSAQGLGLSASKVAETVLDMPDFMGLFGGMREEAQGGAAAIVADIKGKAEDQVVVAMDPLATLSSIRAQMDVDDLDQIAPANAVRSVASLIDPQKVTNLTDIPARIVSLGFEAISPGGLKKMLSRWTSLKKEVLQDVISDKIGHKITTVDEIKKKALLLGEKSFEMKQLYETVSTNYHEIFSFVQKNCLSSKKGILGLSVADTIAWITGMGLGITSSLPSYAGEEYVNPTTIKVFCFILFFASQFFSKSSDYTATKKINSLETTQKALFDACKILEQKGVLLTTENLSQSVNELLEKGGDPQEIIGRWYSLKKTALDEYKQYVEGISPDLFFEQALYEKDFEMWRLNSEGVRSISHLALMRGSTA